MSRLDFILREKRFSRPIYRKTSRGRTALSVIIAVAMHTGLLLAIFGTANGPASLASQGQTGGGEAGPFTQVALINLGSEESPALDSTTPAPTPTLEQMLLRLQSDDLPVEIEAPRPDPPKDPKSLFKAIEAERLRRQNQNSARPESKAAQAARSQSEDRAALDEAQGQDDAPMSNPGGNGLWGFLEPCWRKLPGRSNAAVTLKFTLDYRGRIAAPPTIIRPSAAPPSEERLISEARAIAALGQCLPYPGSDIRPGQELALTFSKRP